MVDIAYWKSELNKELDCVERETGSLQVYSHICVALLLSSLTSYTLLSTFSLIHIQTCAHVLRKQMSNQWLSLCILRLNDMHMRRCLFSRCKM